MNTGRLPMAIGLMSLILSVGTSTAPADEREELEERLEQIRERIERFEAGDEKPPRDLVREEEALERELDRFEEGESDREEHGHLRAELREIQREIERHERKDKEPPRELVERAEHLEREIHEKEAGEHEHDERREIDHALDRLARLNPPEAEALRKLWREEPEEIHEIMGDVMPWIEEMEELRREDPELFEFEKKSRHLGFVCERIADEVRKASGEARKELIGELRRHLKELFEARLAVRKLQIRRVERELKELRTQVERMSTQSEKMIERRMQSVIADGEEW